MKVKSLITLPLSIILIAALFALAVLLLQANSVAAHDGEDHASSTTGISSAATEKQPTYIYTAQAGDSYSKLARKAVQTYGIVNKVSLSGAQIIYIETNMTKEVGSPSLSVGEKITINQTTVKGWIEKAQKLTDEQKANWNYYVQFVDFNTNNVGESR